jgi:biopolymer transport protein ExbB/TolQ
MSLSELLGNVGLFGLVVMACLALLSIYSVGIILDKHRRFRSATRQSDAFKPILGKALRAGELQAVMDAARQHGSSHVAQVVSAGLLEYDHGKASHERVSSAIDNVKVERLIEMKRGLGTLATIGSTAPFIGLFGTVVGIINAFQGIAATGSGGMGAVSGGIAEALVATALGIFVAIPAVVAFNHFMGILERFQVEMNQASSDLTNILFDVPSPAPARRQDAARSDRTEEAAMAAAVREAAHATR